MAGYKEIMIIYASDESENFMHLTNDLLGRLRC
jgi:hypothetical protein